MADLRAGEVLERFRDDLLKVDTRVGQCEAVETEATKLAGTYSASRDHARARLAGAYDDRSETRDTLIAILEAVQGDPEDRETIAAILEVKGRSKEEAEGHLAHLDRLDEESQPVAIVVNENLTGVGGVTRVIYGRSNPDIFGGLKLSQGDKKGERTLQLSLSDTSGFTISKIDGSDDESKSLIGVGADSFEEVVLNPRYPFEDIGFVSSAEGVGDRIKDLGWLTDVRNRDGADEVALQTLAVPTLVAYGVEAVKEVSSRIANSGTFNAFLARRCMEGVGVELPKVVEFFKPINDQDRQGLAFEFVQVINQRLKTDGPIDPIHGRILTFLGPLQDTLFVTPETVFDNIMHTVRGRTVVGKVGKEYEPLVGQQLQGRKTVEEEMNRLIEMLKVYGISAKPSAEDFGADTRLEDIAARVEIEALRGEYKNGRGFHLRKIHRLDRAIAKRRAAINSA